MTRRLWARVGGTLFEEFPIVLPRRGVGTRRLDGLVVLDRPTRLADPGERLEIAGHDVVVIQTKASRLGMNVLGQALFSAELVRKAGAVRVRTIALCAADDDVLRPLAEQHRIEVVVGRRRRTRLGDRVLAV